ncbi:DUF6622 family protein [Sneathiella sp.]|uniref:DUF6622 family protein n=1 Tax=Sneathiella sp. TaxID=1964365 RepID=UPI003563EBF8
MSILDIVSHTPVWVWVLFAFLLFQGLLAMRTRKTMLVRVFLLPVFFFAWGLYAILTELPGWPMALGAFALVIGIGFLVGWTMASHFPATSYDRAARRVMRPGTPLTLILIIIAFGAKYALSVGIVVNPELSMTTGFSILYGTTSGLISGAFWGVTVLQLLQAFGYIERADPPPA